jgi:TrmH family RNA methyltransferase
MIIADNRGHDLISEPYRKHWPISQTSFTFSFLMTRPRLISSRHNPQFKRWVSLLESEGIKAHQQCLVSGTKLREEITQDSNASICEILFPQAYEILENLSPLTRSFALTKELFDGIDVFGTKEPLLVCPIPSIPVFDLTQPPLGLEILCPVGDPGNLGALLRSCRAFGVRAVILLREAVHPFHPKVIRASSGAVFPQSLSQGCSVSELGKPEILKWITPLDMQGDNITTLTWPPHIRLLIGEEGVGIPSLPYAQRFSISQIHTSIPLNATVACSIALHAYRQQHPQ